MTKIELKLSKKHQKYKKVIEKFFRNKYRNSYLELIKIYSASDYLDELVVYEYEYESHGLELVYKIYLKEILSS